MNILGYKISKATNFAQPPKQHFLGGFEVRKETTHIIPSDIQQFTSSLQLARSAYVQERAYLYDMYQNALDFDSALNTVIKKRLLATSGKALWYVVNDKQVEEAKTIINSPRFTNFIDDLILSKVFWGMGLVQIKQTKWGGQLLFDYDLIPIKHIDPYEKMVRFEQFSSGSKDKSYSNVKTALFIGAPDDLGLLLPATLLCLYKREAINQWMNYVRLAGNNFEKIKYRGAIPDPLIRKSVIDRLSQRNSNTIDLPEGLDVEFENISSSSQNELFEGVVRYYNDEITKLVLGQTMTTDSGSSRSQAEVHERTQETLFDSDSKFVLDFLNYEFIDLLSMFGLPTGGRWKYVENSSTRRLQMADLDIKLKELGVIWTNDELRERYSL